MVCVILVLFCYMSPNFILGFYLCNYNYDCKFGNFFFFSFWSRYNNHHMRAYVLRSASMRNYFFSRSKIVILFVSHSCVCFFFFMVVGFVSLCMSWIHAIHVMTWYTCDTYSLTLLYHHKKTHVAYH